MGVPAARTLLMRGPLIVAAAGAAMVLLLVSTQQMVARHQARASNSEFFVVGITSVKREGADYLGATLSSLRCALDADGSQPRVLVFNAQVPAAEHASLQALRQQLEANGSAAALRWSFHEQPGHHALLLHVNSSLPEGLPRTYGETAERVWWRSKETLDTAHLLDLAQQHAGPAARWYVHLQDDVRLAPGFLTKLRAHMDSPAGGDVAMYSLFSHLEEEGLTQPYEPSARVVGMVGLAFRLGGRDGKAGAREAAQAVPAGCTTRTLADFIRPRFWLEPVDFLLDIWGQHYRCRMLAIVPNLVDHRGAVSSLAGKHQPIVSKTFQRDAAC